MMSRRDRRILTAAARGWARRLTQLGLFVLLLALLLQTGCTVPVVDPEASAQDRARARQEDLRRSGSIATRTGMSIPMAVCSRALRILPSTRRLAGMCASASRL